MALAAGWVQAEIIKHNIRGTAMSLQVTGRWYNCLNVGMEIRQAKELHAEKRGKEKNTI